MFWASVVAMVLALCVIGFFGAFACIFIRPCWTFAYASPPQVQGNGGEKVGHQALALTVADFKELAEDGGMTLDHLGQTMPYKF